MTELKEYPWERAVSHRLPPQNLDNIENLKLKAQKLATRNAKLEFEMEQLRKELQRVIKQRSFVKKKAQELSDGMTHVYSKYEELERTVADKDGIILSKNREIVSLQEQLRPNLANAAAVASSACLEESAVFISQEEVKQKGSDSNMLHEMNELCRELANSRQEVAALRAAQLELEGAVAGQLVYSMHANSQRDLNAQTQFNDDNDDVNSSQGSSSSYSDNTPQRLTLANTPGAQRQMAGQSFWTISQPAANRNINNNSMLNMSALSERNNSNSFVVRPPPPRALSVALGQLSPIAPAPAAANDSTCLNDTFTSSQQQEEDSSSVPDQQRVLRLVAALQRAATINNNNSSFLASTNNVSIREEEEQGGNEEKRPLTR